MQEFKKIRTNSELDKVQDNVEQVLRSVLQSEVIDGVLLKEVTLTTGSVNNVDHRLGRKPLGWIIVRKRANATVWDTQDTNDLPSRTLALNSSANVTVDLWVF